MRIRTEFAPSHTRLVATFANGTTITACGSTGCMGGCGLPALVIPARTETPRYPEMKARSSAVAVGLVFQAWPVAEWLEEKVVVPEAERQSAMKLLWL